jgi:hypothetical protein
MNNKDMVVNIVFAIIYLLIILAMILILRNAYELKGDYNYGEGLKQQCSPLFLEKERGEHQVYMGYIEGGYDKFKNIYLTLLSTSVMVIIFAYVLANILSLYYIYKNRKEADIDIKFIALFGLFGGPTKTNKIVIIPEVIIIVILLGLLVYWYVGHHGSEKNIKTFKLTSTLNFLKKTPTEISEEDKLKILGMLNTFIHSIFLLIIVGSAIYNPVINGIPLMSPKIMFNIFAIYITIAIVMRLITETIIDFQNNVSYEYDKYKDELNKEIADIFNSGDKQAISRIVNELEKNITNDEMDTRLGKDGIGAPPNLFAERKYKEEGDLYKYLMHIINNYDIQNIQIPQELKTILNTVYLGGENSLELKKKLVNIYYRHKEGPLITHDDLKENGNDVDLLPYLKARVRLVMVTSDNDAERKKYLNILNTYVVSNTIFKKGNPLPENIIKIMSEHRRNNNMKATIDKYFNTIYILFTTILIIFSYFVYHYMIYPNNLDKKLQVVSLIGGILLAILGIAGWLFKEFWL